MNRSEICVRRGLTTLPERTEQQASQVSWVQATIGGVCRAKKGGIALHFELESAACFFIFFLFNENSNRNKVISVLNKAFPDDNFYFISDLKYTNPLKPIRYRGEVYSRKLKQKEAMASIQISTFDLNDLSRYADYYKIQYNNSIKFSAIRKIVQKKAWDTFGDDFVVFNTLPRIWDYDYRADEDDLFRMWGYELYVDDVSKVDEYKLKEDAFVFYKYMYNVLNIKSQEMYISVRNRKELTVEELKSRIFFIYKDSSEVGKVLDSYDKNSGITSSQMRLIAPFLTYSPKYSTGVSYGTKTSYPYINVYISNNMRSEAEVKLKSVYSG